MNEIRDWNPEDGDACQGDICFFRIPDDIEISTVDEILPEANGNLIIASGEVTGHHHMIRLPEPVMFHDAALARASMAEQGEKAATARLFRDVKALDALQRSGEIDRTDLAIGLLVVEGGRVTVTHDEHAGIRVPEGRYYVGRQVESAGAEERMVSD